MSFPIFFSLAFISIICNDLWILLGHEDKVDCVYLTHPTEVLSFFHLPFGFQTFAAQPFSKKWYIWAISPLSLPIMLLLWMFAKPFTVATHFVGKSFELQTWLIPRFKFQVNSYCTICFCIFIPLTIPSYNHIFVEYTRIYVCKICKHFRLYLHIL